MFESREFKTAKRELQQFIDAYTWMVVRSENDDPDKVEAYTSGIAMTAARYRQLGGDAEKMITKSRSAVITKFNAFEADYCSRTDRLLWENIPREADQVVQSMIAAARSGT
ncbi:hypothetical protein ACWEP5_36300 [Nocardia niigatensis]